MKITFELNKWAKTVDLNYKNTVILVDENTKVHCLPILLRQIPSIDSSKIIVTKSGEQHKNIESCITIWQKLTELKVDRQGGVLINLGGGIINDMGGFAASCFKRGINFINIPTTLLAMVDATVGGKLGVDFNGYKNHIGLFNTPQEICIDSIFLKTLNRKEVLSGFAEVIKHALIADIDYWNYLSCTSYDQLNWDKVIKHSIAIKSKIVNQDPLEKGKRKILNFGHTLGHAIESFYMQNGILHGEAIALGMKLETMLSNIEDTNKEEIINFIEKTFELPKLPPLEELKPFLIQDKKNSHGELQFSLLEKLGQGNFNQEISINKISTLWK